MRGLRVLSFVWLLILVAGSIGAAAPEIDSETVTLGPGQTLFRHHFPTAVPEAATGDYYRPAAAYPPIAVDPKYRHHFLLAPILENGMALLGETNKFVSLADKRFTAIEVTPDAMVVTLAGEPNEVVALRAFDARSGQIIGPLKFTIGPNGSAVARLAR